jgi:hypothetical protein
MTAIAPEARDRHCDVWLDAPPEAEWWRAIAPGPPGRAARRMHLVRARGRRGLVRQLWSWGGAVADASFGSAEAPIVVHLVDGARHEHSRTDDGWHIELHAGGARSSIDLEGVVRDEATSTRGSAAAAGRRPPASARDVVTIRRVGEGEQRRAPRVEFTLGRDHYRRSEQSWDEAGRPAAVVSLTAVADELRIEVDVRKTAPVFAPPRRENELDNEHPDINSDGVQLHYADGRADGGGSTWSWILVPEPGTRAVRVTPRDAAGVGPRCTAHWSPTADGYRMHIALSPIDHPAAAPGGVPVDAPFGLDLIVNEISANRERRRGQLVLSGGGGFVYLRGDRQPASHFLTFVIRDA